MSAQDNNNQEQRADQQAEAAARHCVNVQGMEIFSSATVTSSCDYTHPSPNYFGYSSEVSATQRRPQYHLPLLPGGVAHPEVIASKKDVAAVDC